MTAPLCQERPRLLRTVVCCADHRGIGPDVMSVRAVSAARQYVRMYEFLWAGGAGMAMWQEIASALREAITRGDYPPGTTIPKETELMAAHGARRQPVP